MGRRRQRRSAADPARTGWGTVYPTLDLHGLTGEEAVRRAERWLLDRQAEFARTVVVVTGRGRHSARLPVLRAEVEHLLGLLRGSVVASFQQENLGGSFRVELRRPPAAPPRPAAPEPVRTAPDHVRRAAEEALAELGIAPTPALLAAEIRRILQEGSR